LQVPDGTTAMVRCPSCKTIFSAEASATPRVEDRKPVAPPRRTRQTAPARRTARKPRGDVRHNSDYMDAEPPPSEEKPQRRRRNFDEEDLSPRERKALKESFARAAWGAKLIWISIILFIVSMGLIVAFWFAFAFKVYRPVLFTLAGIAGLFNWLTAAVGVGLCLSGPKSPGQTGYGIAAAVATGVHLLLLLVLVQQDYTAVGPEEVRSVDTALRWEMMTTRLDSLTIYLAHIVYFDEDLISPHVAPGFSIIVGFSEMLRNMLIMMLLSCLARAGGDEDLSGDCTRAGGFVCAVPGVLVMVMLLYVIAVVETDARNSMFARVIFLTVQMGIYAILGGMMLRPLQTSREVIDVCEQPFQSQLTF
jgi:hypothetical protein